MTTKKETTPVEKKEKQGGIPTPKVEKESPQTDPLKVEEAQEEPKENVPPNPIDNLIEFITIDQNLLQAANEQIEKAKVEKQEIVDRLKDLRRDLGTLHKYGTPEQKAKLDALGFDLETPSQGLNSVAQTALDIVANSPKKLTNEELYNAYVASLKVGEEPVNYTQFNIKLRAPFNSQLLVRQEVNDGQGSRTDIIYMNGGGTKDN